MYKAIRKCQIKIPRRVLGLSLCFLTIQGRWEWIILSIWIFNFQYFYFVTNLQKNYGLQTLTAETSPSSPIWASALLVGTPLPYPSIHTLWMTPTSEKSLDKPMSCKTWRVYIIKDSAIINILIRTIQDLY